jgi:hypothetical protein
MYFSRHSLFFFLLLAACSLAAPAQNLVSCNTTDPQTKEKKWGFCDCFYAEVVIKCQYDTTFAFTEGLGRVRQNGKYGFVDKTGKLVIAAKYELADAFSEGFAMVMMDGKVSFIDKKGADVFKKSFKQASPFSNGLAMCSNEEGKRGYIDTKGNPVIPFVLEAAFPFKDGLAPVRFSGEKTWKAINTKGEVLFTFSDKVKSVLGSFSEGLVQVYVDGPAGYNVHYDFVNEKGEFICDAPYASAKPFKNGRAVIAYDNKNRKSGDLQFYKYGLIKKGGREIVSAKYACLEESPIPGIYFYGKTSASISNCDGYGLLDSNGRELTLPKYSGFTRLNDTTFLCKEAGKFESLNQYLLLTIEGKELLTLKHKKKYFEIAGPDTLLILYSEAVLTGGVLVTVYNIHTGTLKENTESITVFNKQQLLLIEDWEFASGTLMTTDGKIIMDKIQTHTFRRDTSVKADIPFILISTDRNKDFKMYNLNTRKIMINDYRFKSDDNPYYSGQFTEGLLPVRQKGKWGFIDTAGQIKLPAIYKSAKNFYEGWAVVSKQKDEYSNYEVYINKAGKEMPGIKAYRASDFNEGFAYFQIDYSEPVRYINKAGKVIFKSENSDFWGHGDFSNGLAAVPNKDGKYGYINTKGELVIPYQFSIPDKKQYAFYIKFNHTGRAQVERDGKKLLIDMTGKEVK